MYQNDEICLQHAYSQRYDDFFCDLVIFGQMQFVFLNSKGTPGNFHSNIADPLAESNLEASTKLCISLEFDLYNLEIG